MPYSINMPQLKFGVSSFDVGICEKKILQKIAPILIMESLAQLEPVEFLVRLWWNDTDNKFTVHKFIFILNLQLKQYKSQGA